MRILHVLDHSLPYLSAYSFRSSSVIGRQRQLGVTPVVLTSPRHEAFGEDGELYDGVKHYRSRWPLFHLLPLPRAVPLVREAAFVSALSARILSLARQTRVDLIHAHSPALNALAAARAARRLGVPWLYELRYYEHDAAVEGGRMRYGTLGYRKAQWLEDLALRRADVAVTNSSPLRAELVARGFAPPKLFEALNGVDTRAFHPLAPDADLLDRYDLAGKTVVGFIGSFYEYEGLDRLVDAMLYVLRERRDVKVLLAGAGEAEAALRARIPRERRDHFVFAGRIEQEDVPRYYSVMDILVYPRRSTRLTELTTSTRPLEAMAMERAVIASGVGGMCELVSHGRTGFIVEADNRHALAGLIARLVGNRAERHAVGRNARAYVVAERDWERVATNYLKLYRRLLANHSPDLVPGIEAETWSDERAPGAAPEIRMKQ
jgi:glycogen synthase